MKGEKGSATLFVLMAIPIVVIVLGLAIDMGRGVSASLRLQWAADAAALAGGATREIVTLPNGDSYVQLDVNRATNAALAAFRANWPGGEGAAVTVSGLTVRVTARSEITYMFVPMAGAEPRQKVVAAAVAAVDDRTHKVSLK